MSKIFPNLQQKFSHHLLDPDLLFVYLWMLSETFNEIFILPPLCYACTSNLAFIQYHLDLVNWPNTAKDNQANRSLINIFSFSVILPQPLASLSGWKQRKWEHKHRVVCTETSKLKPGWGIFLYFPWANTCICNQNNPDNSVNVLCSCLYKAFFKINFKIINGGVN